jgi:predicted N-acetyltransferase YhbS
LSLLTGLVQDNLGAGPIPTALVAHEGDTFVGTVSLIACDEETRPQYTPWVAALWVEPEYRRQGVGAALVEQAASFAFGTGAGRVYLLSGPHRQSFYEALGWTVLEMLPDDGMLVLVRDAQGVLPA